MSFSQLGITDQISIINIVLTAFGSIIAVLVFIRGINEYRRAQDWKRSEFALQQLEQLNNNFLLGFCCMMLDGYNNRRVILPQNYSYIVTQTGNKSEKIFIHSIAYMYECLKLDTEGTLPSDAPLYRDALDRMLNYLERIEHSIKVGLITIEEVAPLKYWLERLARYKVYMQYIHQYESHAVLRLMIRFKIDVTQHNLYLEHMAAARRLTKSYEQVLKIKKYKD